MTNSNILLFLCLFFPLCMMTIVFKKQSKLILISLLAGMFMCLFAGELNGLIIGLINMNSSFFAINISPIIEELLKAFPILIVTFFMNENNQTLVECSMAVGVGFAIFENVCLFFYSFGMINFELMIVRSLGAGFMHVITLFAVSIALTFIKTKKQLYVTGIIASLSGAIIYHSIYNIMILSKHPIYGILLPISTYTLILILCRSKIKRKINVLSKKVD